MKTLHLSIIIMSILLVILLQPVHAQNPPEINPRNVTLLIGFDSPSLQRCCESIALSHDGSMFAYSIDSFDVKSAGWKSFLSLYFFKNQTSRSLDLNNNLERIYDLNFSPDDKKLLFVGNSCDKKESTTTYYVFSPSDIQLHCNTLSNINSVDWMPDGSIVILRNNEKNDTVSIYQNGIEKLLYEKQIGPPYISLNSSHIWSISASPDGKKIALWYLVMFDHKTQILDVNTGKIITTIDGGHPEWSADGHTLSYTLPTSTGFLSNRARGGVDTSINLLDVASNKTTALYHIPTGVDFTSITPNGTKVLYATNPTEPYKFLGVRAGIYAINLIDGNNMTPSSIRQPVLTTESPLKQFKSRIAANDVKCQQDLQLVIKAEDGSPACVKPDTAIVLVEHRWATNVPQPNPMAGLNNGTGIATLGNQAYYFETANYTDDAYHHPIQISFHDVVFTLFPSGFRGGLPAWGCGGSYYWTDAKFSDGTSELLQIFVGDQQCFVPQPSTHFSIHKNPQAGLTFYDGKMKLLVSVDNQASQNPFTADKDGKVDLSQIHLPPNNYGQIDYDKIGYLVSEDKFKKMLEQLDIKYADNNFLLLTGESLLSYPPFTGYCGYVMDDNKEEHWFSSSFHRDTLTSYKISRYNPEPCKPGFASCFCNLQTKIAENSLKQLSYFSKSEEEMVGDAVVQYLDKTKVVNVSNDFSVGKYNLQADPSLVHYCGKFTWGEQLQYFEGYMKDSNVVFFELAPEQQKLCAINADAKIFSFEYKENVTGK